MKNRVKEAQNLFQDGYNCAQSVFAAYSDLYGFDRDTALKISSSFGGGVGRMREICGAVSGMCMIAGLETGTSKKMDDEGKKYNYEVVQKLTEEFKSISGSIICRELLGLDGKEEKDTTPQKRTEEYYNTRPCEQLVMDAAEVIQRVLYNLSIISVMTKEQIREVSELAEEVWHEHYDSIIGKEQVNYMIEKFQSEVAMKDQMHNSGYLYYQLKNYGGHVGYFAIQKNSDALFLSKIYIAKKYRGRDYSRRALEYMEQLCREWKLDKIWLTVNRHNENSIKVYEKLGFERTGSKVTDIGCGYVMDDYIMEKKL